MRAVQCEVFECRLIREQASLAEILEGRHDVGELILGVSLGKPLPVGLLTVDEHIVRAQLGLEQLFGVSTAAGDVGDLDLVVAVLDLVQECVEETRPILVLGISLNPGVPPADVRVVVHERGKGKLDPIDDAQAEVDAVQQSRSHLRSRIDADHLVLVE